MSIIVLLAACGGSGSERSSAVGADSLNGSAPLTAPSSPAPPGEAVEPVVTVSPAAPVASVPPVAIKTVAVTTQLSSPWALAFLPDGRILVTERIGNLRYVSPGGVVSAPLTGVPAVRDAGQGGLLDVAISSHFDRDRTIFFSFAEPVGSDQGRTAVASAELGESGISNVRVIYRQTPARPGTIHYGSRLVFDRDGFLYVTLGERGEGEQAQDLATTQGKVVRILPDGSIPPDNPVFAQAGAVPGIWSYGHRNPQGTALNPLTGELWISEHGPRGGDEINRVLAGRNYGWPRITHGRDYGTGRPLGEGTEAPDVEPPLHYWVPVSVAPSGMIFYTGDKLPGWEGSLLVGALAGKMLARLELQGDKVVGETRHLQSLQQRIRDVRQGPDGYPYLLTDGGQLLRVVPQ